MGSWEGDQLLIASCAEAEHPDCITKSRNIEGVKQEKKTLKMCLTSITTFISRDIYAFITCLSSVASDQGAGPDGQAFCCAKFVKFAND